MAESAVNERTARVEHEARLTLLAAGFTPDQVWALIEFARKMGQVGDHG
jgi:hypothetical protein